MHTMNRQMKTATWAHSQPLTLYRQSLLCLLAVASTLLFTACQKYNAVEPNAGEELVSARAAGTNAQFITTYGVSGQTLGELMQVRAATRQYQDTLDAIADGYANLNLKLPNMGFHFGKRELIEDGKFDLSKPEFLVYNPDASGKFQLVAVEYGVPIDPANPITPPAGFTGDDDEWDRNTLNTGLWTLHAWVWKFNPDGVFKMMNPDVIVP